MKWWQKFTKYNIITLIDDEWKAQLKRDDLAETMIDLSKYGTGELIGLHKRSGLAIAECEDGSFGICLRDANGGIHKFYLSSPDALQIASSIIGHCYGR